MASNSFTLISMMLLAFDALLNIDFESSSFFYSFFTLNILAKFFYSVS
jgi:hypothetical protein